MSVEKQLSDLTPAEPPDRLRERVLALAVEPSAPVWRSWLPIAAAAAVLLVTVIINHRIEAGFAAHVAGPARASRPRADQPYGPRARLPITANSWARLHRTLTKETS